MSEDMWMPIETAPKDGEEIIAWDGLSRKVVYWLHNDDFGQSGFISGWWSSDGPDWYYPLSWQPLPEPPSSPSKANTETTK